MTSRGNGERGWDDGPRPEGPVEALWMRYGERLEHLGREAFGSDKAAVHAVCYLTLFRAGDLLANKVPLPHGEEAWDWLVDIAEEACDHVRARGVEALEVPEGPLPDAVPALLRLQAGFHVSYQRAEERSRKRREDTWLRDVWQWLTEGPKVLIPALVWRVARRLRRELEPRGAAMSEPVSRLGTLAAVSPSMTEMAAAATALATIVAMGPASTPAVPEMVAARPAAVVVAQPEQRGDPGIATETAPTRVVASGSGATPVDAAFLPTPEPKVEAATSTREGRTIREDERDEGVEYVFLVGEDPVVVDADGDGRADQTVLPPSVGVGCHHDPAQRGLVTGVLCLLLLGEAG